MGSAGAATLPRPRTAGSASWTLGVPRLAALQWVSGIYLLVLGMSLLLLPRSVASVSADTWQLRGAVTAATGIALLWVAGTAPPRIVAVLIYLLAAALQALFAVDFLVRGSISGAALLGLLAVGIVAKTWLANEAPAQSPRHQPDAVGLVFGTAQALQGAEYLVWPAAAQPLASALGIPAAAVGTAYLATGVGIVAAQLAAPCPARLREVAHLLGGGFVLAGWVAISLRLDPIYWVLGVAAVVRGVALASLPWWGERAASFDGRALRPRLAIALATAAIVPVLVVLTVVYDQDRGIGDERTRQLVYGFALLTALASATGGWWLAGHLVAPLADLTRSVGRVAENDLASLPQTGASELRDLASAVDATVASLAARTALLRQREAERERLLSLESRARGEAEAALQSRDEFVAVVAHDLRNPLASIKGFAQLMQRRGQYSERAVNQIIAQANLLQRLVSDLLDASPTRDGRLVISPTRTDICSVARAAVEQAAQRSDRHTVQLNCPEYPLEGLWDPDRLAQVFQNLLSNAIKYAPAGGEITVSIEDHGSQVRVDVRDPGLGIPPEALPRVFDRFYRVADTAGQVTGLGLGLTITRSLVEAHGGRIWVDSAGRGRGATFSFTLPCRNSSD